MPRSKKRLDLSVPSSADNARDDDDKNVKRSKIDGELNDNEGGKCNGKDDCPNEDTNLSKGSEIIDLTALKDSPSELIQTTIDQYLCTGENPFHQIKDLSANTTSFRIRCKVIRKSVVRSFGVGNKMFDAIACDRSGEIKLVAYNDQVDRFYELVPVNRTIIVENGCLKSANPNYRTPYSTHEILLLSNTSIHAYNCPNFKPNMAITRTSLRDAVSINHGTYVDVEGTIISSFEVIVSTSASGGGNLRRKSLRIKEETSTMMITFWNSKIDEIPNDAINKIIRIRNGRVNHYMDNISINVSDSTTVEFN